jgi:UDP-N-acetylmuramate dehydrogenase
VEEMDNKIYKLLTEIVGINQVLVDEPMKNHTSFKIGGPVDFMVLPKTIDEIKNIVSLSNTEGLPLFIMGNGSNLLVRDKGIRGLVIKIAKNFSNIEIIGERVITQSGVLLSGLAKLLLRNELTGFEFASGIPGTLGGAVTMNAGAYGGEMKDVLEKIEVMDKEGNISELKGSDMQLGYRKSAIQEYNLIALSATMKLQKGKYEDIKAKMEDLDIRRKSKQPLDWPSAGSTFRRPEGYYAGKLVQDAGLKGLSMGRAQVSDLHSGFVINKGDATAEEIITLIRYIQSKVKEKFGVNLQTEVKIIGEE